MKREVIHDDNMDPALGLPAFAPDSLDAIVQDPPSGINFMGLAWDGPRGGRDKWIAWLAAIAREELRVLKPGGYSLTWALPRVSHWTATALEDAGFEIRDVHHHLFGTGMPKGLSTKTTLKPAVEHWILARKPFACTVADNEARYGTGRLGIDDCRIAAEDEIRAFGSPKKSSGGILGATDDDRPAFEAHADGSWPAHLSLDEHTAGLLDEQSGWTKGGVHPAKRSGMGFGSSATGTSRDAIRTTPGGASRFFYVAKPSKAERSTDGEVPNDHATVKSIALMRWLVRLVCPPGGTVLDAFAGSGTTGVACALEGRGFVGIEKDEQGKGYVATARDRIRIAEPQTSLALGGVA